MLLVDAQRLRSKPLLCSQPTDTTRLLAQLTPMLLRAHQADAASSQLLALHEAQRAWTRRAATDASAPLERARETRTGGVSPRARAFRGA